MRRRSLHKLFDAYKKGTCTPQEMALLNKWLDELGYAPLPENPEFEEKKQAAKEEIWQQQLLLIQQGPAEPGKVVRFPVAWRVAAVAVGLVAGLYFLLHKQPSSAPASRIAASSLRPATDSAIVNNSGKPVRHQLPDGSVFTLSPGSTATVALPWANGSRVIKLRGEALFETSKDQHRPFSVHAKGFVISTLGTVFRVSAYDSLQVGNVKLISGKILVHKESDRSNTIYLKPGNEYSFNSNTGKMQPVVEPKKITAPEISNGIEYTEEGLAFHNTPLLEVFKTLAETYGESIKTPTGRSFRRMKYTGDIKKSQSLESILKTLTDLNDLSVVRKDSIYYIQSK